MRWRLFILVACVLSTGSAVADDPLLAYSGTQLYQRFCASCHGDKGYGDGPVAGSLNVMVPDLTRVSRRYGGRFPAERIQEVIDGRAVIPAHGGRLMPVWGYEFEARGPGRDAAQDLIDRLAGYLREIQQ